MRPGMGTFPGDVRSLGTLETCPTLETAQIRCLLQSWAESTGAIRQIDPTPALRPIYALDAVIVAFDDSGDSRLRTSDVRLQEGSPSLQPKPGARSLKPETARFPQHSCRISAGAQYASCDSSSR